MYDYYGIKMTQDKRNFIIVRKHKRWQRLWQFFFTGWGLMMIAALIAASLFTKQLLWTPISAINMMDMASNQFKMSGASFSGLDSNGEPFHITAQTGRQEYDNPDVIFLDTVAGNTIRAQNGTKVKYNFSARHGEFNRVKKTVKLYGNVRIKSSDKKELQTNELVVKL